MTIRDRYYATVERNISHLCSRLNDRYNTRLAYGEVASLFHGSALANFIDQIDQSTYGNEEQFFNRLESYFQSITLESLHPLVVDLLCTEEERGYAHSLTIEEFLQWDYGGKILPRRKGEDMTMKELITETVTEYVMEGLVGLPYREEDLSLIGDFVHLYVSHREEGPGWHMWTGEDLPELVEGCIEDICLAPYPAYMRAIFTTQWRQEIPHRVLTIEETEALLSAREEEKRKKSLMDLMLCRSPELEWN